MTIKECIDIVDNAKPNQYGIKEKVMWLSFVDETIINDVLKTHEGYDGRYDNFEGYTEDKLSVPLIVPSPYDRLYPQYIKMMIDSENGETARYNNSSALYNTYLNEYKKYYNKTHMPLNATQKIPSPVSININSALSEAQIEYIKRQLYYMLSQDVDEVISHDKLYDIAMEYYQNNTEVLKGKDGKSGAMIYSFPFAEWNTGEEYHINFDWENQYNKDDHPGADNWKKGDIVITANGKVAEITNVIRHSAETWLVDFRCFADIMGKDGKDGKNGTTIHTVEDFGLGKTTHVGMYFVNNRKGATNGAMYKDFTMPEGFVSGDLLFDGKNGLMFDHNYREYSYIKDGVTYYETYDVIRCIANLNGTVPEGKYANIDLSNVSDEDFKAKAEAAGVGGDDAGLADEKNYMVFKGVVSELPETANEGEVYVHSSTESGFEKETEFTTSVMLHLNVNDIRCEDSAEATLLYNTVQSGSFITMKLVIGGSEYIYRKCSIYERGPDGTGISSDSCEGIDGYTPIDSGTKVEVYKETKVIVKKTSVYHNGEWVEL